MYEMHEKTCPECNSPLNARDWKGMDKGGLGLGANLYIIYYISCGRCGWQKRVGEKWTQK